MKSRWTKLILVPLALLGIVAARSDFKTMVTDALADLQVRVAALEDSVLFLLGQDEGGSRLVVVDATGQELGPAYPQADEPATPQNDDLVRVIIDVPDVGLVACDVRGWVDDGGEHVEPLVPVNSNINNEVFWTGPGCTGTPFSLGLIFKPAMLPSLVSVASVHSGTYVLGEPLPNLAHVSAEGYSRCMESEPPFVSLPDTVLMTRIGDSLNDLFPAPYSVELR